MEKSDDKPKLFYVLNLNAKLTAVKDLEDAPLIRAIEVAKESVMSTSTDIAKAIDKHAKALGIYHALNYEAERRANTSGGTDLFRPAGERPS